MFLWFQTTVSAKDLLFHSNDRGEDDFVLRAKRTTIA
jgi:hypothetical protein